MKSSVRNAGDYRRQVQCGACGHSFVVDIHNIEKVLLSHICTPLVDSKIVFCNGDATAPKF